MIVNEQDFMNLDDNDEKIYLSPELEENAKYLENAFPGVTIKDYLGGGTYGKVWRVQDSEGKKYVIKQMRTEDINNEVKILQKLHCQKYYPCIVDVVETKYYIYIVMENLPGYIDLYQWVVNETKNIGTWLQNNDDFKVISYAGKVSKISCKLFEIIQHLHDQDKIIHNDIKPTNILIDPSTYDIKLIDFGLSCSECKGRLTSGSPDYRAPEMVWANKDSDFNFYRMVDLYALGATIFYMLYQIPYMFHFNEVMFGDKITHLASFKRKLKEYGLDFYTTVKHVQDLTKIYNTYFPILLENVLHLVSVLSFERNIPLKC